MKENHKTAKNIKIAYKTNSVLNKINTINDTLNNGIYKVECTECNKWQKKTVENDILNI